MATAERKRAGRTARIAPWSRFEEAALDSRVLRRLFTNTRAMVVHCELAPRTFIPTHTHKVEQLTTCLSGRIEVRLLDRELLLDPGQAVRIRIGMPHSVRVVDPAGAETLNVFEPRSAAPPR